MSEKPDNSESLPFALHVRLRAGQTPAGGIPEALDRAILADAHASLGRPRQWRKWVLAASTLAAAACIGVAWMLWPSGTFSPDDINHDGHVNIVDAYLLAKKRAAGDATVSAERVEQLAMLAVKLDAPRGGGAP